jgi:hypothetical protein
MWIGRLIIAADANRPIHCMPWRADILIESGRLIEKYLSADQWLKQIVTGRFIACHGGLKLQFNRTG